MQKYEIMAYRLDYLLPSKRMTKNGDYAEKEKEWNRKFYLLITNGYYD